jgi:hypothetical protein
VIPGEAKFCSRHAFRMSLEFSPSLILLSFLIFIMHSLLQSKLTLLRSTCICLFLRNWPTANAYVFGQAVFVLNVADLQPFSYVALAGNLFSIFAFTAAVGLTSRWFICHVYAEKSGKRHIWSVRCG